MSLHFKPVSTLSATFIVTFFFCFFFILKISFHKNKVYQKSDFRVQGWLINIPVVTSGLLEEGNRLVRCVAISCILPVDVVTVETPSVLTCAAVDGVRGVVTAADISVVALWPSVELRCDRGSVVFTAASSLVVKLVAFGCWDELMTVK